MSVYWDVDQVLNYSNNLMVGSNLKNFNYKLVMLSALTTVSRALELTHLDIRYMINYSLFYFFTLTKPTSAMKPGDSHPKIIFKGFENHKNLFVCKALEDYLQKTASLKYGEANLLTTPIKPHKKVAVSAVSRWLKCILQLSDINMDIFKAHSTRSVSTSKEFLKAAFIKEIMKTACWSNESTFQTCFNRKVVEANSFQSTVI